LSHQITHEVFKDPVIDKYGIRYVSWEVLGEGGGGVCVQNRASAAAGNIE